MEAEIRKALLGEADKAYAEFAAKLQKEGHRPFIGVSIPKLRWFAKELVKRNPYKDLLNAQPTDEYFEERLLRGLIIGYGTKESKDIKRVLADLDEFIPAIDSWSVCDAFAPTFTIARSFREDVYSHIQMYMSFGSEFSIRTAIVLYMSHFLKFGKGWEPIRKYSKITEADINNKQKDLDKNDSASEILEDFLKSLLRNYDNMYYAQMGAAWFFTEAFCYFPSKMYAFLKENKNLMDPCVYGLTVRKIRESKIPDKNVKDIIKDLISKGV